MEVFWHTQVFAFERCLALARFWVSVFQVSMFMVE
jgi:hypothetical protein